MVWVVAVVGICLSRETMELCHNLVVELQLLQVKVVPDFDCCLQSLLSSHYCSQLLAPLTAAAMERCWREHAAFTLLLFRKESEEDPSYWTGLCMSSWKDVIILRSFEEQPIFCSRVKRLFLQTRSKALVRSVSVMYSSRLCLQHLSFSWSKVKTTSIVDLPALNLHCAAVYAP